MEIKYYGTIHEQPYRTILFSISCNKKGINTLILAEIKHSIMPIPGNQPVPSQPPAPVAHAVPLPYHIPNPYPGDHHHYPFPPPRPPLQPVQPQQFIQQYPLPGYHYYPPQQAQFVHERHGQNVPPPIPNYFPPPPPAPVPLTQPGRPRPNPEPRPGD